MKMSGLSLTVVVMIAATLLVGYTDAACNTCNSNGAACISKNEFRLCFNNIDNTTITYTCPMADQVCTAVGPICASPATQPNVKPACGDTTKCGQCTGASGDYTCTSRKTFTMCFDGQLSDIRGTCPEGEFCYSSLGSKGDLPCATQCVDNADEICDLDVAIDAPPTEFPPTTESSTTISSSTLEPVTTTTIFSPTPTISTTTPPISSVTPPISTVTPPPPSNNDNAVCASKNVVGRFPYPNDTTCTTYLNCYKSAGTVVGSRVSCPQGRYFNGTTNTCEGVKPSGCL